MSCLLGQQQFLKADLGLFYSNIKCSFFLNVFQQLVRFIRQAADPHVEAMVIISLISQAKHVGQTAGQRQADKPAVNEDMDAVHYIHFMSTTGQKKTSLSTQVQMWLKHMCIKVTH